MRFSGQIPSSKSMLNRLRLIKSYAESEEFLIEGESSCDDVQLFHRGLSSLKKKEMIDCGSGAMTLRFLALAASRRGGLYLLKGSPRLMRRSHEELVIICSQLGVQAQLDESGVRISSEGWRNPGVLHVSRDQSSQFASAVLLNSWGLEFDLEIRWRGEQISDGYFQMTVELCRRCGMEIDLFETGARIPKGQKVKPGIYEAEIDLSSAFAVAALGAVGNAAEIIPFPKKSLQPDAIFLDLLKGLRVHCDVKEDVLSIRKTVNFSPIKWSLRQAPDLFPVASVLCSLARGTSKLYGAPQLKQKESNRIAKTAELLQKMGCPVRIGEQGLEIMGKGYPLRSHETLFDPDEDHRMVMAAAIANAAGYRFRILNQECVRKSFPEFLEIAKDYLW